MDVWWMVTSTRDSVKAMLLRVADAVLRIGGALLVLLIGWLVAKAVKAIVVKILKTLPIDEWARQLKITDILHKGEIRYQLSELVGVSAYWVILLAFLLATLDLLGMSAAAGLLDRVLAYVPNVVAGIIVLILGFFFGTMVSGIVQTAAANAGVGQAKGLAQLTYVTVVVFAVAVALEKFLNSTVIQTTFNTVVTALAFGVALAFGLGCKDLAGRSVDDFVRKLRGGR